MTAFSKDPFESDGRGIRAAINRHPWRFLGAVGALLTLVVIFGISRMHEVHRVIQVPPTYYSDDNGVSVFEDSAARIPPFDHGGREAVRAYCTTGADGKPAVQYLEKWTPHGQTVMAGPPGVPPLPADRLIKRPQDANWLPSNDPALRNLVSSAP